MKIKPGFLLREVAESCVVVAVGPAAERFRGMIRLNSCGAMLFRCLTAGATRQELVDQVLQTYDVARPQAETDVDEFLRSLLQAELLEEN